MKIKPPKICEFYGISYLHVALLAHLAKYSNNQQPNPDNQPKVNDVPNADKPNGIPNGGYQPNDSVQTSRKLW